MTEMRESMEPLSYMRCTCLYPNHSCDWSFVLVDPVTVTCLNFPIPVLVGRAHCFFVIVCTFAAEVVTVENAAMKVPNLVCVVHLQKCFPPSPSLLLAA